MESKLAECQCFGHRFLLTASCCLRSLMTSHEVQGPTYYPTERSALRALRGLYFVPVDKSCQVRQMIKTHSEIFSQSIRMHLDRCYFYNHVCEWSQVCRKYVWFTLLHSGFFFSTPIKYSPPQDLLTQKAVSCESEVKVARKPPSCNENIKVRDKFTRCRKYNQMT